MLRLVQNWLDLLLIKLVTTIQRLIKFEFISLEKSIEEIHKLFADAIDICPFDTYINDIEGIYSSLQNVKTDEFVSLINAVKRRNNKLFVDKNIHEFLNIIKDKESDKPLRNFRGLTFKLFEGISLDEFIDMFLNVNNSRKGEFLQFFSDRYALNECLVADKDFVASLIPILSEQITHLPKSATFVYCKKLHEILFGKLQRLQ